MGMLHKVIEGSTKSQYEKALKEATNDGYVLSSQFGVSLATVKDERGNDKLIRNYHIMVSKMVQE